jgi:hypothetical protein
MMQTAFNDGQLSKLTHTYTLLACAAGCCAVLCCAVLRCLLCCAGVGVDDMDLEEGEIVE